MATRFVLTAAIFQLAISGCRAVNGIIWRKQKQEFVQLFSIPQFAALQEENLAKRRAIEMQDMKEEVVKAVFYEEKNMVMFYDNDTKVRGVFGDVWYLLADYLNFTFIPIKVTDRTFGEKLENGSYNGLVGMLERNEAQVIMRSGFFQDRMNIVEYTMPLWKSMFHIYVRPEWLFDNTWVFTLFSRKMWFFVMILFIILSLVGYFLQKVPMDKPKRRRKDSADFCLGDHFFYSFAMMTAKGYIPDPFYNKFKILSLSKSIFAWLILLAFSSHLIYRMANREMTLPFKDLGTLLNNTKYVLLVYRGSFFYNSLNATWNIPAILQQHCYIPAILQDWNVIILLQYCWNILCCLGNHGKHEYQEGTITNPLGRMRFVDIAEVMHNNICNNMTKYAMFEIEDRFRALNRNGCPLQATGNYNRTWITFAVKKNFSYKKTIDSALIKFMEVGLIDGLRDHWLNTRVQNPEQVKFKMIDLRQVYLIFLILCIGALISLVILVLENITYYYNMKTARQRRRR